MKIVRNQFFINKIRQNYVTVIKDKSLFLPVVNIHSGDLLSSPCGNVSTTEDHLWALSFIVDFETSNTY